MFSNQITLIFFREFRDDEQCHSYLANPKVAPLPRTFQHARNAACLWDPRYGFWYRESCNGAADTLTFTVYTDSACKKKITRPNVISLHSQTPGLNQCIAHYEANHTLQGYRTTYCHL